MLSGCCDGALLVVNGGAGAKVDRSWFHNDIAGATNSDCTDVEEF